MGRPSPTEFGIGKSNLHAPVTSSQDPHSSPETLEEKARRAGMLRRKTAFRIAAFIVTVRPLSGSGMQLDHERAQARNAAPPAAVFP